MNAKEKAALGSIAASAGLTAAKARHRPPHRLACDPVRSRPFLDRPLGDAADLFCRAHFRQAGRRRASIRPRQGRIRHRACRNGVAVRAHGRGDLRGDAAADRRASACGRSDGGGLCHHRRLDRGRFFPRAYAQTRRQGDFERSAGSGCPPLWLRHVVVGRGADRPMRRGARLSVGRCRGGDRRCGVYLHRRLAARAAHHQYIDRHCAGRRQRARRGNRAARAGRRRRRAGAGAAGRRGAVRRPRRRRQPHAAARPRRRHHGAAVARHPRRTAERRGHDHDQAARAR